MSAEPATGWQRIDNAAFGIIYGAIMVLSIMMAAGEHPEAPSKTAAILFGSVLAVTLAKAFAELMSHALATGNRLTRDAWRAAWDHSSPTLAMANLPTLLHIGAALGLLSAAGAAVLSQWVCIALLAVLSARVGWVIDGKIMPAVLGGLFAGGIGAALALMKFLIH